VVLYLLHSTGNTELYDVDVVDREGEMTEYQFVAIVLLLFAILLGILGLLFK